MNDSTPRDEILKRIKLLGLPVEQVARLAGLSRGRVRAYLGLGRDTPTDLAATAFFRLADALGMDVSLAPKTGYVPPPPTPRGRPKIIRPNPTDTA